MQTLFTFLDCHIHNFNCTVLQKEDCEEVIGDHAKLIKQCWCPRAIIYDPLKAGSIDGTDSQPHDRAIMRAQNADYKPNKNVKGDPECTIFVARLHPKTTVRHLKEVYIKKKT